MRAFVIVACALVSAGCGRSSASPRTELPSSELTRTELDRNKNGRTDAVTYSDAQRVVRAEIDADENGIIERWEHYGPDNQLEKVGTSAKGDGIEDTWSYADAAGFLIKEEFDEDRDGRVDKRNLYAPAPGAAARRVLLEVELDIDESGSPARRMFYRPDGSFDRVEKVR